MQVAIRPVTQADTAACGRVLYAAFRAIADRHGFVPDFANVEQAIIVITHLVNQPTFYGVVAETAGRIVGSNFLAEADPIRAVGPVSVDPGFQAAGVGRLLMQAVLDHGRTAPGVRLVQDAFNSASMALYTSLGFAVREPLVLLQGKPAGARDRSVTVRPMRPADIGTCAALCERVHGAPRTGELHGALRSLAPLVAERGGRITAYTTTLSFWQVAHGVAESEADLQELILGAAALSADPVTFLLPTRQTAMFRWCLAARLRIQKPMTLMTLREYQEPRGCYFPSVAY